MKYLLSHAALKGTTGTSSHVQGHPHNCLSKFCDLACVAAAREQALPGPPPARFDRVLLYLFHNVRVCCLRPGSVANSSIGDLSGFEKCSISRPALSSFFFEFAYTEVLRNIIAARVVDVRKWRHIFFTWRAFGCNIRVMAEIYGRHYATACLATNQLSFIHQISD